MTAQIKLSQLVEQIQETIQERFEGRVYWVATQITNVKKYVSNRRCYLTLEEYDHGEKKAELKAVFWSNSYNTIEEFEKATGQLFTSGLQIICKVKVRFHKVYGLNVDVLEIDIAHTLGSLELEKQKTLERLVAENPTTIQFFDGEYQTFNNRLPLPLIVNSIALITAPNSDGQRDFQQEIFKNKHGYQFVVKEFLTTIQGDNAHKLIFQQLQLIQQSAEHFDAVAIVRGGGSATDFKPFDEYELAKYVAHFPIPIYTGIGHDRNQSIVDQMAREQKTPTKVAALFIDHNFEFENRLMKLKTNFFNLVAAQIENAKNNLNNARRMVKLSSPQAILNRGFAIVTIANKIVTNPNAITENAELQTILRNQIIYSTVTKKEDNDNRLEL
ncbi:MAG: exodeoxyribonuclease VII large subunit [Bacteroidota bacterium]